MTPDEAKISNELDAEANRSKVLILGMDAHMDWDWLNTFQTLTTTGNGNGQGSVNQFISQAWQLMIKQSRTGKSIPIFGV